MQPHIKTARSHVLDSWQCIFYGQFWNKKWNTRSFTFYILVSILLQIVKNNISWNHAVTSMRLLLIFIRFQNDTTLKLNFKRLRKCNSCSIQKKPHRNVVLKCCSLEEHCCETAFVHKINFFKTLVYHS